MQVQSMDIELIIASDSILSLLDSRQACTMHQIEIKIGIRRIAFNRWLDNYARQITNQINLYANKCI